MKFLHVSTGDTRGAFAGAYRLHRNLLAAGHESMMLVGDKQSADPTVVAPGPATQALGRFLVRLANQVLKAVCGREQQVAHHLAINHPLVPVRTLVRLLGGFRPDLVVVYYTSGFLSPGDLQRLQAQLGDAPIALYLMDMEMLTGGCHYAWTCKGYLAHCENCPVPRAAWVQSLIRRQWMRRRVAYERVRPVVVSASGWLARQAAAGRLTATLPQAHALIGIDAERYAPADKPDLRRRFGLPENGIVLYFGAQNLDDPRKGFRHLRAALSILPSLLTPSQRGQVVLFTVGKLDAAALSGLEFAHIHRTYIADPSLFASTYAAADLFICPSVEDSGPMMINESIMSGTPVAAFEMGVAVDLVVDGETGYRVPLADAAALASALGRFIAATPQQRMRMQACCRERGLAMASADVQVRAFEALALRPRQSTTAEP